MTDEVDPERKAPKEWVDALDEAEADLAAGRICDGAIIHAELRASIERMERGEAPADGGAPTDEARDWMRRRMNHIER